MPGLDLSQSVFAAGGTAATDWGQASGAAEATLRAAGQLKRGIHLEVGAQALASVDLGLSQFLTAQLSAQAQATAGLTAQVQLPMNLFGEIGVAVRLQAIAELAVAVQASVGLSIGDFIERVEQTPEMQGLPARLFRVFLEEVDVSAGLYAKAALTAQAFAELVMTGTALHDPARGLKPGFNIVAGMGAGLKGGAGYRMFARLGIRDVPRLICRSTDLLVDETCDQLRASIPPENRPLRALVDAARAPSKMAIRLAYELGEYLAQQAPPRTAEGARAVALRCSQVVLEEGQRFLLSQAVDAALQDLLAVLDGVAIGQGSSAWTRSMPQRRALADHLQSIPPQPFEATPANLAFWTDAAAHALGLVRALGLASDPRVAQGLAVFWTAGQLAMIASGRVARVSGSVSIVGLPTRTAHAAFKGPLPYPAPHEIDTLIRARVNKPAGAPLEQSDLLAYLCDTPVLDFLRMTAPGVEPFLYSFSGALGLPVNDAAAALLSSAGAIRRDASGRLDDVATLEAFATALRLWTHDQLEGVLAPSLRQTLPVTLDVKTVMDEVLLPSVRFAVDTIFDQALNWTQGAVPAAQLTEALSAIVLKVLGRSVVAAGDVLLSTVQHQVSDILTELADHVDDAGGIVDTLIRDPAVDLAADDLADLLAEVLRIAAEVHGPFTGPQRQQLRSLMYRVLDPMPSGEGHVFLAQLAADNFVPQSKALVELAQLLGHIGTQRFLRFAALLLERVGHKMLEELQSVLASASQAVVDFARDLERGIAEIARRLFSLIAEVAALEAEVERHMEASAQAILAALTALDTAAGRHRLRDTLIEALASPAQRMLERNDLFRSQIAVPVRHQIQQGLHEALRTALTHQVVDRLLDAIGDSALSIDQCIEDVRDLDPRRPLAPQLLEWILDRIENQAEAMLGDDMAVELRFTASWTVDVPVFVGPAPWDWRAERRTLQGSFDLGRLPVPLDIVLPALRGLGRRLGAFESAIGAAATQLAAAFATTQRLGDLQQEQARLKEEETRLTRHRPASVSSQLSVGILSPSPLQAVSDAVRLQILLDGADEAILDEGPDVPPRVLAFLNGARIRLEGFTRTHPAPTSVKDPAHSPTPGRLGKLWLQGDHRRPALLARMATPQLRSAGGRAALLRVKRSSAVASDAGRAAAAPGPLRGLGRPLSTATATRGVSNSARGLLITGTLPWSALRDGVNVLNVVVFEGSGRRSEDSVSFFKTPPVTRPTRHKRPTLPVRRDDPVATIDALPAQTSPPDDSRRLALSVLPPLSSRRQQMQQVAESQSTEPPDPLRRLRDLSPAVARRLRAVRSAAQAKPETKPAQHEAGDEEVDA